MSKPNPESKPAGPASQPETGKQEEKPIEPKPDRESDAPDFTPITEGFDPAKLPQDRSDKLGI